MLFPYPTRVNLVVVRGFSARIGIMHSNKTLFSEGDAAMSKNSPDGNPLAVALRLVFSPLVKITSKLPAPLAYGAAIILAVLVTVLLGAIIPENLIWPLVIIVLACLAAFLFVDWGARHPVNEPSGTVTVNVIVHEEGDPTAYIKNADVSLSLPVPQTLKTNAHGSAVFASLPREYVGREFPVNAIKKGYKKRSPQQCEIANGAPVFLGLEPLPEAVDEDEE